MPSELEIHIASLVMYDPRVVAEAERLLGRSVTRGDDDEYYGVLETVAKLAMRGAITLLTDNP